MSASPSQLTQSSKRPLEEASSPTRHGDQPDAKRPALDKVHKKEEEVEISHASEENGASETSEDQAEKSNGTKEESEAATTTGDVSASDAAGTASTADAATVVDGSNDVKTATAPAPDASHAGAANASQDESTWLHIRAVITSPEAATVIGKGGENVSSIRKMSGAKCTVSDYQKGAVERILTVSGVVDAVAKAFGLIVRTLNNEPLADASTAQSKTYPLRLLVPHILIGSIIGKGGARIREIQEASGARLNASDSCLPLSSERSLVVMGVADAVHIATYYVASTLLEQLNERGYGPGASAYATRSGGAAGAVPGGMQVVPYCPQPAGGSYGDRENYNRHQDRRPHHHMAVPAYGNHQYGGAGQHAAAPHAHPSMHAPYAPHAGGYAGGPQAPHAGAGGGGQRPQAHAGAGAQGAQVPGPDGPPVTQQIYIPNDMVGAIIGKGGVKINEIRTMSGSVIKINEPMDNSNERLVTITGTEPCNRMALYLLYTRLEQEKHRA